MPIQPSCNAMLHDAAMLPESPGSDASLICTGVHVRINGTGFLDLDANGTAHVSPSCDDSTIFNITAHDTITPSPTKLAPNPAPYTKLLLSVAAGPHAGRYLAATGNKGKLRAVRKRDEATAFSHDGTVLVCRSGTTSGHWVTVTATTVVCRTDFGPPAQVDLLPLGAHVHATAAPAPDAQAAHTGVLVALDTADSAREYLRVDEAGYAVTTRDVALATPFTVTYYDDARRAGMSHGPPGPAKGGAVILGVASGPWARYYLSSSWDQGVGVYAKWDDASFFTYSSAMALVCASHRSAGHRLASKRGKLWCFNEYPTAKVVFLHV
ncbi:hypothetical protein GGF32_003927 [Allomyces javanicus]|nr:hypothetical protein GGF32_003927 [Allomyces javanicus]